MIKLDITRPKRVRRLRLNRLNLPASEPPTDSGNIFEISVQCWIDVSMYY